MTRRPINGRASASSWADEVIDDQNLSVTPSPAQSPIRPLGGSNEAYSGLGKRSEEQGNSMSSWASDSRVPHSEAGDESVASYPNSSSVSYRRNISPSEQDGPVSHYPGDAPRGRQMERKGSVSRERSPEGMASGSIGRALSGYYSLPSPVPTTRGRRTALDPLRFTGRDLTNRSRDTSPEGASSGNIARALHTPDSPSPPRVTRGRRTALDPFNTTEQAMNSSSREHSPDRATHEDIDAALSGSYGANYRHHVTRGRQTAMNPFNSVGRVPASSPQAPSPASSGSSDALTTVLHSWGTWESMRERLQNLKYLDLETGDLFESVNETRLEIRTIARDLFVKAEDLQKYTQSRSASPMSAADADDSGMLIPSEGSNVMYTSRGPESGTFNERVEYAAGFIHSSAAVNMSTSPFAGYFANRSPDELQQYPHTLEPANLQFPSEYADHRPYRPWHERYPLEPGFGVWSPEGRQRIMITLQSLGLSLYTPVDTLEKYLVNNPSIILHVAGKTTPMRPTVSEDCFETVTTGAAFNFNKRLYTAMREVAWNSVEVLDILALASVSRVRYAAAEQEFNRRGGASRVPRKSPLSQRVGSGTRMRY